MIGGPRGVSWLTSDPRLQAVASAWCSHDAASSRFLQPERAAIWLYACIRRNQAEPGGLLGRVAMQKVVGSSPIIRFFFLSKPLETASFSRLRRRVESARVAIVRF
jgi:hypothetical protein